MSRAAALAAATLMLGAAPAAADVSVSSFSVAPASTTAGAGTDVAQDIRFASTPGDTVKDLTLSLAPGLLANPTVGPACAAGALEAGTCPAGSRVDDGASTVRIAAFGFALDAPAELYLVAPGPGELARIGLVVAFGGVRVVREAPVSARTSGDAGLDIAFTDLPRTVPGTAEPLTIERVRLTLPGAVNTKVFTRLPTACVPAVTRITGVSHAGTPFGADATFVPSACELLAFAPSLEARAVLDAPTGAVALETTITQATGEAAVRSTTLALPAVLTPRLTAIGRACSLPDPAACPETATVGAAAISTPLLAAPLRGRVVLASGAPLPGLAIVLPPPFPLRLAGTTALRAGGMSATFAGIPDVPISSLRVAFAGGPDSLFTASRALCAGVHEVRGDLTAHSGATAQPAARLAVSGCGGSAAPRGTLTLRGFHGRTPVLTIDLTGRAIRSAFVRLPRGVAVRNRGLRRAMLVAAGGRVVHGAGRVVGGRLQVRLRGSGTSRLSITLRRPALRVSGALAGRVRAGRPPRLTARVTIGRAGRAPVTLTLRGTPRR